MSDNLFKLQINFTKSYIDDAGNHFLEGVASGPEVDLTDERMSPDALKSMVPSIRKHLIEFRDAHKQEWNDDLGEVVDLSLDDFNHLVYRSKLDMNLSGSKDLWYRVHTLGKKYGVSIGGAVLKAGMEYVAELGKEIFTYFDVDLYEISITRQAAYQYSFANAVLKSLPKKEDRMNKSEEAKVEQTEDETTTGDETVTATTDTNLTESEAAATDAQEEAHDATETTDADTTEETADAAEATDAETETEAESEDVEKSTDATKEQTYVAAEETTAEVAKSAVFGNWAEINLVTNAIHDLSWTLQDHVWSALYNDEMTPAEKLTAISDGLDDFKALILKVATALVDDTNAEEVKRAAEAFKATSPEAVSKSLTEKDTKVEELTKSLSDKTTELETVHKSLTEANTKLETLEARKSLAFQSGAKSATLVDPVTEKSANTEPSIGELYYQKIGALPEAA